VVGKWTAWHLSSLMLYLVSESSIIGISGLWVLGDLFLECAKLIYLWGSIEGHGMFFYRSFY
jgi:hypothetical protein